ncbi:unnamed protein product, partial [Ectocarpus sp. 6 AP-2014]
IEGVSLCQQGGGWGRLRIHVTLDAVTGSVSPEFAASIGGNSFCSSRSLHPTDEVTTG